MHADGGDAFFQTQPPQHGHDAGHQRFADDQIGPPAIVEHRDVHPLDRQQRRERQPRRAAADDPDRFDPFFHRWILPLAVRGMRSTI